LAKTEKIILADRKHPLYEDNEALWSMYLDGVRGGSNFISDDYLFTHRLEDSEDFDERKERGYLLNYMETIPSLYNVYIFKERISRAPDLSLEYFRKNTDGRGTNIDDFVKKIGFYSSVFGAMHVLVDMPFSPKTKATKHDVKSGNIQPYGVPVYPQQLKDWSFDRDGQLRWIVIESTFYKDLDPAVERIEEKHYRLITTKDWRIEDEDGLPVKFDEASPNKGANPLGVVPLVSLYHKDLDDDRVGESLIKDIVYVNRTILNWCSLLDEQIERQTFSQLVTPDDGTLSEEAESKDDPLHKIGTSSIWTFPHDATHPPAFISPRAENLNVVWNLVVDHIKEIYRMGGLMGSEEGMYVSRSGRSAQMGFMSVNSSLADKAAAYQKFENDLSRMAYLQLGEDTANYTDTKFADSFNVSALAEEIDAMFKVMRGNFSPILNKEVQKNMARKALPLTTEDIRKSIEDEIEAGDGVVASEGGFEDETKPFDDGKGNPNTGNIANTHRTKDKFEKEEKGKQKKEK